jgi:hypothetical protein
VLSGARLPRPGRRKGAGVALLAAALLAGGCTTDIRGQPGATGAVVTYRAPGIAFGGFATYALASRVGLVTDTTPGKFFADAPGLLAAVSSQLDARGFQKVAEVDPASPPAVPPGADLAVNITALASVGPGAGYWIDFAGYSRPADLGLPGYDWVYPWPWVSVGFQPGTVLVEVSDLRDRTPGSGGQILMVWAALAYGVAPDGAWDAPAVIAAVDEAFSQSAYLATP